MLVTGADGFVGSRLVPKLVEAGHRVVAAIMPRAVSPAGVPAVPLDLEQADSISAAVSGGFDAVIHLAAMASGAEARSHPAIAWRVNAVGTAMLAEALGSAAQPANTLLLLVSTAEVYGAGAQVPRREDDPLEPTSPYAASKLGAEVAALEVHRRTGLRVVIARAFPHTGPGQQDRYFVPAMASRIRAARRSGAPMVRVGNLDVVREMMHVDDVADAYVRLLAGTAPSAIYNVACGDGVTLATMYDLLCAAIGYRPEPEPHPSLMRAGDIPYMVGDGSRLRAATGWSPKHTLEETLREVVNAQAD